MVSQIYVNIRTILKKILIIKIVSTLVVASIMITLGAYSFATGDKKNANTFFTFALISTGVALLWFITAKRFNRHISSSYPFFLLPAD